MTLQTALRYKFGTSKIGSDDVNRGHGFDFWKYAPYWKEPRVTLRYKWRNCHLIVCAMSPTIWRQQIWLLAVVSAMFFVTPSKAPSDGNESSEKTGFGSTETRQLLRWWCRDSVNLAESNALPS